MIVWMKNNYYDWKQQQQRKITTTTKTTTKSYHQIEWDGGKGEKIIIFSFCKPYDDDDGGLWLFKESHFCYQFFKKKKKNSHYFFP